MLYMECTTPHRPCPPSPFRRSFWSAFTIAALLAAAAFAADTQPAAGPPDIDKVISIAPINLKTNAVTPQKAFEM
jgi:hypothetical protein